VAESARPRVTRRPVVERAVLDGDHDVLRGAETRIGVAPELRVVEVAAVFPDRAIDLGDHGLDVVRLDDRVIGVIIPRALAYPVAAVATWLAGALVYHRCRSAAAQRRRQAPGRGDLDEPA
jgi:hypothetical protein